MSEVFYWGAATAAYQIEGAANEDGRGDSIWDSFVRVPHAIDNGDTGEVADDSYHKVQEDVQLLKDMGLNAYRFSISWSRILPDGTGAVNQAGIDHYNFLIDTLLSARIEPFVTLYHWDLPQALQDKYLGLLSPEFEVDFTEYADVCFRSFGDRVKKWVTINEPWTVSYLGFGAGTHAPGRCSNRARCQYGNSSTEPYIVGHNLLNAHAAAVQRYRTAYQPAQQGQIGIVLNLDWGEPLTRSYVDNSAAVRHNEFQLGWFGDPIFFGRYPDSMRRGSNDERSGSRMPEFTAQQQDRLLGSVDFLGVNHYSTRYYVDGDYSPHNFIGNDSLLNEANRRKIRDRGDLGTGWAFDQRTVSTKYDLQGRLIGPQAESEWLNLVPWGFTNVLVYLHNRYSIAHSHLTAARSTSPAVSATASATADGAEQKGLRNPLAAQAQSAPAPGQVSGLYESGRQRIPIYVTENGCDAPGEATKPLEDVLHDAFRISYLSSYLAALQRARRWGVDVRGYFVWSLLDNFEWADGYGKRFGLVHVDYNSPNRTRTLKDSARWYAQYAQRAGAAVLDSGVGGADAPFLGYGGAIEGGKVEVLGDGARTVGLFESGVWSASAVLLIVFFISVAMRVLGK